MVDSVCPALQGHIDDPGHDVDRLGQTEGSSPGLRDHLQVRRPHHKRLRPGC